MSYLKRLVSILGGWFKPNEPVGLSLSFPANYAESVDPWPVDPDRRNVPADLRNVPGDFVVEANCCLLCGIPWHFAPDLFDYDNSGCWVKRQPVTEDERGRMVSVLECQDIGCIKYRGTELKFIRLTEG
jgi:hypothetical protein